MRTRTRAAVVLATTVLALLAQLPLAYAANNVTIPVLEKAVALAVGTASSLRKLAYAMIGVAFFIGVIHWLTGRGPDWIIRAVMAVIIIAAGLWVISYFMS